MAGNLLLWMIRLVGRKLKKDDCITDTYGEISPLLYHRQFQKTSCFLIFHLKLLANSLIFIFKSQRVCFIFLFAQKTVFCPITFHKKAHQSQSIIVFIERLFFKLIFFLNQPPFFDLFLKHYLHELQRKSRAFHFALSLLLSSLNDSAPYLFQNCLPVAKPSPW